MGVPLLLLTPALIVLVGLRLWPIIEAFWLSFTSWDGLSSPEWVGFDNYVQLAHDEQFKSALVHNLEMLLALPVWIFLPYAIAQVLHSQIFGWRLFRLAFFLPTVLSPVVIGLYFGIILAPDGPFADVLHAVGLGSFAKAWLNDPSTALPAVIAIIVWWTFGIGTIIFLAGLGSVDQELIHAARVDGATGWQIQRHVMFWQMLPVIEFWSVLVLIASFTSFFPVIFALTNGGPGTATYTVDFDVYKEAFNIGNLGYASAVGVVLLAIVAIIGALQIWLLKGRGRWR